MRVVHLIEPCEVGWSGVDACLAVARARIEGFDQRLVALGGAPARAMFERAGGAPDQTLSARPGARELRRVAETHVLHAWSAPALRRCLRAGRLPARILATALAPGRASDDSPSDMPPIALLTRGASIASDAVLATHEHALRGWPIRSDSAEPRWSPAPTPPGGVGPMDRTRGERLREAWGFEPCRSLVAMVGDPVRACDARRFAFIVGVLGVAGLTVGAICPDRAHGAERAARFVERLGRPWPLLFVGAPWREVAPAVDVAIWLRSDERRGWRGSPLSAWCARAMIDGGARVVAERSPESEAAIGGLAGAELVEPGSLHVAARVIESLRAGPPPRSGPVVDHENAESAWIEAHRALWLTGGRRAGKAEAVAPARAVSRLFAARS